MNTVEQVGTRHGFPETGPYRQCECTEHEAKTRIRWGMVGLGFVLASSALVVTNYPALKSPMIYDSGQFILSKTELFQRNGIWDVIGIIPVRPLFMVTLYLNYLTTGMDPQYFRLVNIVLTALTGTVLSLLIFLVLDIGLRETVRGRGRLLQVSLFLGFIFAIHPLQTFTTLYIWQREATLAALFYFAAIAVYLAARSGRLRSSKVGYGLSSVLFFAGMLCKENVITVPAVLLLADAALIRCAGKELRRSVIRVSAIAFVPMLLYFPITNLLATAESRELQNALSRLSGYYHFSGLSLAEVLLTECRVFFVYLTSILAPIPGTLDLVKPMTVSRSLLTPPITIAACAGVAVLVGTAIYLFRRRPVTAFGILFFAISLIPESVLIPYYLFFGYRAILPMAGVLMIIAEGMLQVAEAAARSDSRVKASRIALGVIVSLVVVGLLAATHLQSVRWNPLSFWEEAYGKLPQERSLIEKKPYLDILNNLTVVLSRRGNMHEAEEVVREAVELYPDESVGAVIELGNALLAANDLLKAVEVYRGAIRLKPTLVQPYVNLGAAYVALGSHEKATRVLRKAVSLDPKHARARANLGISLVKLGLHTEAIKHLDAAVKLNPKLANAHFFLGAAWENCGDTTRAVMSYERALGLEPTLIDVRIHLAKALIKLERHQESIDQYQRVLQLDPKNYRIHTDLARLFMRTSQFDRAIGHSREALRLKPDFKQAGDILKSAHERTGARPPEPVRSPGTPEP
ncbi:MAG: tetratricopeptide repeat protein [Desulfomonilaceae bacterium]|nr:tetratricopeptide repeat protein [Desulfomonilaceae bacterium]